MKNLKSKLIIFIRGFVYNSIYLLDTFILRKKPGIFILCYHSIANDSWRYGVSMHTLEKQINYLLRHYNPVSLKDIKMYIKGEKNIDKPSFAVTFDDGYKDVFQSKEFFRKNNIRPALFLLSNTQNANRAELDNMKEFLTKKEILDLKEEGWIIGSHSATHSDFYKLTEEQVIDEVVRSKGDLERNLEIPVDYIAYPKGRYTDRILRAVKNVGYTLGLTMDDGDITPRTNLLLIPRVGVDRTHTFGQFRAIFLPSAIRLRKLIKERIGVIV